MTVQELLDIVGSGETSKVQFKEKLPHQDSMAAEMIAMSNSLGGIILLGVEDKTGEIKGLVNSEIRDYNIRTGNIASNLINSPIYITTEIVSVANGENRKVLIVHVVEGTNKPYKDNNGAIWTKQGSDKRRVTDNTEILRLFQKSGNLSADEMEVFDTSIDDVNQEKFLEYFRLEFKRTIDEKGLSFEQALKAKKVLRSDRLTLAGLLFFGKDPQLFKPAFTIKAVSFFGNSINTNQYRSKPEDFKGTLPELFRNGMEFFNSNLHHVQKGSSFNIKGVLEISHIALEELLINSLIHRDYLKNSPVRLLIFDDRIEIISPGTLPNSLTVEEIKFGNPVIRNNQIVAFSSHTMPYSGLGSGIARAIEEQPNIELINDIDGELFIVRIPRQSSSE